MIVWLTINSLLIVILGFTLFLTVRQVGILLNQVGPVGARGSSQGPRVGENISAHVAVLEAAWGVSTGAALYVFGSESCAVCASVRKAAETLARYWAERAAIRIVYDPPPRRAEADSRAIPGLSLWYDRGLRERLGIELVPFGVMTNADGEVIGKGIINDASQLESLLELLLQDSAQPRSRSAEVAPMEVSA